MLNQVEDTMEEIVSLLALPGKHTQKIQKKNEEKRKKSPSFAI